MTKKIVELLVVLVLIVVLVFIGRPKLAAFYHNQGFNYLKSGSYDQAIVFFERSLKLDPSSAVTHYCLANVYLEKEMVERAIEEGKRAIQLDPRHVQAYALLSGIYSELQMYPQAFELLKQAEGALSHNQEIEELLEVARFNYAAFCLDKALGLFLSGEREKADILLHQALKVKPDFSYAYYALGCHHYAANDFEEAEVQLNEAIRINPQYWQAHKLLGDIAFKKGDHKKAINRYRDALLIQPNNPSLHNDVGVALMEMELYPMAVTHLEEALKLEPDNSQFRYNLANTYRDDGMFDAAIKEYKQLIDYYRADYTNLHNNLGDIFYQQKRKEEAIQEYYREIELANAKLAKNPNDVDVLNSLSRAYQGLKKNDQAKEIIVKALTLVPDYRDAYLTLAKIEEKLGNQNGALVALAKARSLSRQADFIDKDIQRLRKEIKQKRLHLR